MTDQQSPTNPASDHTENDDTEPLADLDLDVDLDVGDVDVRGGGVIRGGAPEE